MHLQLREGRTAAPLNTVLSGFRTWSTWITNAKKIMNSMSTRIVLEILMKFNAVIVLNVKMFETYKDSV